MNSPRYTVSTPDSASEIGTTILALVDACEQAGFSPQLILAGVSAASIQTLKRYGAASAMPVMLRREADRLEQMDALDRAASGK